MLKLGPYARNDDQFITAILRILFLDFDPKEAFMLAIYTPLSRSRTSQINSFTSLVFTSGICILSMMGASGDGSLVELRSEIVF